MKIYIENSKITIRQNCYFFKLYKYKQLCIIIYQII